MLTRNRSEFTCRDRRTILIPCSCARSRSRLGTRSGIDIDPANYFRPYSRSISDSRDRAVHPEVTLPYSRTEQYPDGNPLAGVERKERKIRKTGGESDGGGKKDTGKEGKEERKRERERERSRASCSHYLTYYTGSMPPRPSRGPTSLHLASLGSPFALLTGLPSASSFCLPPAVLPLTPSHTRRLLSPPRLSRHARASPLPHGHPPAVMCPFFPLPSICSRFLSFSLGGSFRASRPHPPLSFPHSHPAPAPPRPPPPTILIDRSCTRARSASPYHLVSSPSTRSRSSLSLSPPFSLLLLLPLSSFFLPALLPPPFFLRPLFDPSPPLPFGLVAPLSLFRPLLVRGINYSKNLYCYYYRLTIPSALKPETCTRVQYNARLCSRPADYVDDSEGDDGDDGS